MGGTVSEIYPCDGANAEGRCLSNTEMLTELDGRDGANNICNAYFADNLSISASDRNNITSQISSSVRRVILSTGSQNARALIPVSEREMIVPFKGQMLLLLQITGIPLQHVERMRRFLSLTPAQMIGIGQACFLVVGLFY